MKLLSYILLSFLLLATYSCKDNDEPYVGYIKVDRIVIESNSGATGTVVADTDISGSMEVIVDEADAEWCEVVSVNGKEITIRTITENTGISARRATLKVKRGYRSTTFTVLQKYKGQEYLEYNWGTWKATGSDVQASDGGGYPSLFTDDRTTFWHSQYSPALDKPLPHHITVDMQQELAVAKVEVGRRYYAANGNNYPTVKTMEIYASTDNINFDLVGQFTFALPWTAPDGTIVNGNSPKVPGSEEVKFDKVVTARYFKMVITETNNTNGTCQVSFFKAFEKL